MPHCNRVPASARNVISRSVIVDMLTAMPDLEELRLSDGISQGFLEVIKEEETLVPKLSRNFILDIRGSNGTIVVWVDASRW